MALKIKSTGLGSNKGWFLEPIRHGLARKGVKTVLSKQKSSGGTPIMIPIKKPENVEDKKILQNLLTMSEEEHAEFIKKHKGKDLPIMKRGKIEETKEITKPSKLLSEKEQQELIKQVGGKIQKQKLMEQMELAKEREYRKLQRKRVMKSVGRGIRRGVSGVASLAEKITPIEPKQDVRFELNLGESGRFKRRNLTLERRNRAEAERVRRQTTYIKNI